MAKAIRILVYEGPDFWVEATLEKSYVQPEVPVKMGNEAKIKEVFREVYSDDTSLPRIGIGEDKKEIKHD